MHQGPELYNPSTYPHVTLVFQVTPQEKFNFAMGMQIEKVQTGIWASRERQLLRLMERNDACELNDEQAILRRSG